MSKINLGHHYNTLYQTARKCILENNYQLDALIDAEDDLRQGITLRICPPETVKNNIQTFLKTLKTVDGHQYYYPNSDIHITVMSIISCYSGFDSNQISVADYILEIESCLKTVQPFQIQFKGITASPSCVMIQGFLKDDTLNSFRNTLRKHFKRSALQQSLDVRYTIETAHATVVRFKSPIVHNTKFVKVLDDFRDFDFGTFTVQNIELVQNDWYQRKDKVNILNTFKIEG
ncbi:2'-5' RNA ligase family protein [Formosa sp. A9]|uniref:2'-5' RNA ligase family protein n=1 Tax=Formosa sp. A9 TaxID=3442641 RepID=UPI003EBE1DE6